MHISLFSTCFNDTLFPQTGRAVVELLERLGQAVEFPETQTCCGQMHYNTGIRFSLSRPYRSHPYATIGGIENAPILPYASTILQGVRT